MRNPGSINIVPTFKIFFADVQQLLIGEDLGMAGLNFHGAKANGIELGATVSVEGNTWTLAT